MDIKWKLLHIGVVPKPVGVNGTMPGTYLENDTVRCVHVHDDSLALQGPDPQGQFQFCLQLVR